MSTHDRDPLAEPPVRAGGRRTRGSKAAARLLVRRLEWTRHSLFFWTGTPAAAAPGSATDVLQQRLRRVAPGAFAVRMARGKFADRVARSGRVFQALIPVIVELGPLNAALIARSLRRLLEAGRFPKALPQVVGNVAAWRSECEAAIGRVRRILDAVAAGDVNGLARACLVVGELATLRKLGPGVRTAWPLDVAAAVEGRPGAAALRSLSRGDSAGDVAAAVRDLLLFQPDELAPFVTQVPALLEIARALDAAPDVRRRSAAAMQRRAIESSVHMLDAAAELASYVIDPAPRRQRELARFGNAYRSALEASLRAHFYPGIARDMFLPELPLSDAHDLRPLEFFERLMDATHLRATLIGEPAVSKVQRRRHPAIRWSARGAGKSRLISTATGTALTVGGLATAAAEAILKRAAAEDAPPSERPRILALAALGAIRGGADEARWVAACCRLWPLGGSGCGHVAPAAAGLYAARGAAAAAATGALAEHAELLLRFAMAHKRMRPRAPHMPRDTADATLCAMISAVGGAAAAGLDAEALAKHVTHGRFVAVARLLERAPAELPRFSAALDRWERRLVKSTRGDRRPSLDQWQMLGDGAVMWAAAHALLSPAVIDRMLDALQDRKLVQDWALHAIRSLSRFVSEDFYGVYAEALDPAVLWRRRALAAAVPVVLIEWRKGEPLDQRGGGEAVELCLRCLAVAVAAEDDARDRGGPGVSFDAVAFYRTCCAAALARAARGPPQKAGEFFGYVEHGPLQSLVAIARGDAERVAAIGLGVGDVDDLELAQVREAWRYLRTLEPLPEMLSDLAAREGQTQRVIRLLARLGLCLRLRRHGELRQRLAALVTPRVGEACTVDDTVYLAPQHVGDVAELRRWRGDGSLPDRVAEAMDRPRLLKDELARLRSTPGLSASAARRAEHVERLLGDAAKLAAWARRDLGKLLPPALDEARLARIERVAREGITSHFAEVMGVVVPAGGHAREERNWDNALRLYLTVEANRALLRRLLRMAARGERTWFLHQPRNVEFLEAIRARGVDGETWLAPMTRVVEVAGVGPVRLEVETDPLHVLQMGNYFSTCLSVGGMNAFSTVANAVEVNKRVVYAYDARGVVIGRKLVALTRAGELLGFCTYGTVPSRGGGQGEPPPRVSLKPVFDAFCVELARRCGARLHPKSRSPAYEDGAGLSLFAQWYNDGPEPFEGKWVEVRRAKRH